MFKRKQFKLVVHLFYEGLTELDYLQQITKDKEIRINKVFQNSNPISLAKEAIERYKILQNQNAEIWPLPHFGADNVTTPSAAQVRLHELMPRYDHRNHPYIDLSKMVDYQGAIKKAKAWEASLDGQPEYDAAKFAGVYKLTEKIMT